MNETDVLIIGAGHNGLTCAAYLGDGRPAGEGGRAPQGGRRRRGHGGIPSRVPQFGRGLYRQPAQSEDHLATSKLAEHGLRIVERRAQNFLPSPDGRYLLTGEGRTQQSVIAKLSERDAAGIDAFNRELEAIADVLRAFVLRAPPNIVAGLGVGAHPRSLQRAGHSPSILRKLSLRAAARAARPVHAFGRRDAGRALRERSGQGAVRVRRHRRQLRQPLRRRARPM